jgi:hypothetical protein
MKIHDISTILVQAAQLFNNLTPALLAFKLTSGVQARKHANELRIF